MPRESNDGASLLIDGTDAIGPLSDGGVLSDRTNSPTFEKVDGTGLADSSQVKKWTSTPGFDAVFNGRDNTLLAACFPVATLELTGYVPLDVWKKVMNPEGTGGDSKGDPLSPALSPWDNPVNDWGMGGLVSHMQHNMSPDMTKVEASNIGTVNAFVPDISGGRVPDPSTLKDTFEGLYDGKQSSYNHPSELHAGGTGASSLNPAVTVTKLGGWLLEEPSLGKWSSTLDVSPIALAAKTAQDLQVKG